MWGVVASFGSGGVRHSVPGWLLNAGATYHTVRYVDRLVAELTRAPETYAFDPAARYTAFIQTWDTAWHNMRSLAFGRRKVGESQVDLVPDPYFLGHHGYQQLRHEALQAPEWSSREPLVVWRGSVTGAPTAHIDDIPRIALALACRDMPGTDVRLIGVHPTMDNAFEPGTIAERLASLKLEGDRWPMARFGNYRYVLDIDGHANAWGFLEKLILGCCVLKVESVFEQWYYDRLRPWVHYVPVSGDLSDLEEIIDWCYANDDRCAWIGENAARAAATMRFDDEVPNSCQALLSVAHLEPPPRGARMQRDRTLLSTRPFAVAEDLEDDGRFGDARAEYRRLAAVGQGGAATYRRLARLYQEDGDFTAAIAAMGRAVAIDSTDWRTLLAQARLVGSLGQDVGAAGLLRIALTIAPGNADLLSNLAAVCLRLDWADVAAVTMEPLPATDDEWWGSLRSTALDRRSDYRRELQAAIRKARGPDGQAVASLWPIARPAAALGRLSLARHICERLLAEDPSAFAPAALLVRIIQRTDGVEAALAFLQDLPELLKASPEYPVLLAATLIEQGSSGEALSVLDERPDPCDSFGPCFMKAAALLSRGQAELLRQHCATWLKRRAEDHPVGMIIAGHPVRPIIVEATKPIALLQFCGEEHEYLPMQRANAGWKRLNPTLEPRTFDDASAVLYLQNHFGEDVAEAFKLCRHNDDRAALLRYAFLYREGGVWFAPRERCLKRMDSIILQAAGSQVAAVRSDDVFAYLFPFFLGARAGSPVMAALLAAMTAGIHDAHRTGDLSASAPWSSDHRLTRPVAECLASTQSPDDFMFIPVGHYRRLVGRSDA